MNRNPSPLPISDLAEVRRARAIERWFRRATPEVRDETHGRSGIKLIVNHEHVRLVRRVKAEILNV